MIVGVLDATGVVLPAALFFHTISFRNPALFTALFVTSLAFALSAPRTVAVMLSTVLSPVSISSVPVTEAEPRATRTAPALAVRNQSDIAESSEGGAG
jgi:hypothetical protein